MPMIIDKIKMGDKYDRRIKIDKSDHEIIREKHKGGQGIRSIARSYGVDKRLIQFILFPERQAHAKALQKERRKDGRYYNKDKHREAIRSVREYKRLLLLNNQIKSYG